MAMVGVDSGSLYRRTHSLSRLAWSLLGRRPLGAILHSANEPGELSQWLCHDYSTINIVLDIIIIIIIIIIFPRTFPRPDNSPPFLHGVEHSSLPLLDSGGGRGDVLHHVKRKRNCPGGEMSGGMCLGRNVRIPALRCEIASEQNRLLSVCQTITRFISNRKKRRNALVHIFYGNHTSRFNMYVMRSNI